MKRKPYEKKAFECAGLKTYVIFCHNYAFQCHNHMFILFCCSNMGFLQCGIDILF